MNRLLEEINGAHYVHYEGQRGAVAVWHGGPIVNVYTVDMAFCVFCWSYMETPDLEQVKEDCNLWAEQGHL